MSRVLLTLEDGDIIVAKRFAYVDHGAMGVMVDCDDGSHRLFAVAAAPTHAEFYGVKVAPDATYEEKSEAIKSALEEIDERGEDLPDTGTLQQIDDWLNAEAVMDEDQIVEWRSRASQYGPGLALMDALSWEEQKALGMRQQDLGGPASSVPCATTTASLEQLNAVIAKKNLPFFFIDEDGPEER
jgi:hypothetical protein